MDRQEKSESIAVVLTTIRVANLLQGYVENIKKYNHKDVCFIIIGDMRTPHQANKQLAEKLKEPGIEIEYWDIETQLKWLKKLPRLAEIIPFNSDNRRNIGYLRAAELGADIIITIDDDNYAGEKDFIGGHSIVGKTVTLNAVSSSNKWFNNCSLLNFEPSYRIYPRGYPYNKRWNDDTSLKQEKAKIMLNLGLWTGDPDVDAITRLSVPAVSTGININEQLILARNNYTSINSQNTAFHRELLPCCYYVLMGAEIEGTILDRYGDIWWGFFVQKILNKTGDRVSIGHPIVNHIRNQHDLFKDLRNELWGMILTEHLIPVLDSIELSSTTYPDLYIELADELRRADIYASEEVKSYFNKLSDSMEIWVESCGKIL